MQTNKAYEVMELAARCGKGSMDAMPKCHTPANGGLTNNAHTLEHYKWPTFGDGAPTAGGADVDADNQLDPHVFCLSFGRRSRHSGITVTGHGHASCSGDFAVVDVGDYSHARDATAQPHHNR